MQIETAMKKAKALYGDRAAVQERHGSTYRDGTPRDTHLVGTVGFGFFSVKGSGKSFEEAFAQIEARK